MTMPPSDRYFCDFRLASIGAKGVATCGAEPGSLSASIGMTVGPTVYGFVRGNQSNVTGQIAAKFAIEAFTEAATAINGVVKCEQVVQHGLREANRRVYEYSTKMLAASKVSSTGLFSCFDGRDFNVARTGDEEGYLWRGGEITPLFKLESGELGRAARLERFIGANKHLLADLATLKVRQDDVIWLSNLPIPNLRIVADINFNELTSEAIALELATRLGSFVQIPRGEKLTCGVFLFEALPIMLRQIVE